MIDYLCLKLGWSTDEVMDNAHFDNQRKFHFYSAIDEVERTRLLPAIPLGFNTKVTRKLSARHQKAVSYLNKFLRGSGAEIKDEENPTLIALGGEEGARKFLRDVMGGKVEMVPLFSDKTLRDRN